MRRAARVLADTKPLVRRAARQGDPGCGTTLKAAHAERLQRFKALVGALRRCSPG